VKVNSNIEGQFPKDDEILVSRLVAMSTKQYRTTFPPSAELEHNRCSQVAIKSFPGFVIHPISKSQVFFIPYIFVVCEINQRF
jgi:hypothetical protein